MKNFPHMRRFALAILLLAACSDPSPVKLQLMDAPAAAGQRFAGEWTQTVVIEREPEDVQMDRELRAGFRIEQADAAGENSVNAVLAFDSVRAAVSTPHGRQVFDMRGALHASYRLSYSRSGGPPAYLDASPEQNGAPSVQPLLDVVFPAMPSQPVQEGDSWEHEWMRTRTDGMSVTERPVTTRYTLKEFEALDGETVARIDLVSSGGPEANPADSTRPGTMEAQGTLLLDIGSGIVRSVTLEETVTGAAVFPGGISPYRQTTRYRLVRQANGGGL
jgi:hypothetical protein